MNVKSGARMCNIYVCVFISYAVRRVARACMHAPSASASAMRESHVGAHVVYAIYIYI